MISERDALSMIGATMHPSTALNTQGTPPRGSRHTTARIKAHRREDNVRRQYRMFTRRHLLYAGTAAAALGILRLARPHVASAEGRVYEVTHSDDEWRKLLTPEQFNVLRREGTERPFTSALLNEHHNGTFGCAG